MTLGRVQVEFNHRYVFQLPYEFIRDSCPSNFDARRSERLFSISSVGSGVLHAEDAGIVCSETPTRRVHAIAVVWHDGSETELDVDWVFDKVTTRMHTHTHKVVCTSRGPPPCADTDPAAHPRVLWGSEVNNNVPAFDFKAVTSSVRHQLELSRTLQQHGLVIIKGASTRSTVLGELWHGVFKAGQTSHPFQVCCTSDDESSLQGIPLHSERAFAETPPGFLAMHCSRHSCSGGGTDAPLIFVDGARFAEALRAEHAEEYEVLCSTPVSFAKVSADADVRAERPILELGPAGDLQRVSFDEQRRMRWEGSAEQGGRLLKALNTAANLLYRSDLVVAQAVDEGDVVLLDARRVMWGQIPAATNKTDMHCTLDCSFVLADDVCSRLRVLHRIVGDGGGA